jgi:ribosomal protein S18 acetylase RimI-like enzyme
MSQVSATSSQQTTSQLLPLPIEPPSSLCCKAVRIALKALAGLLLGVVVGALLTVALPAVSPALIGIVALTAGLVAGLVYAYFSEPYPPLVEYRIKMLDELQGAVSTRSMKDAIAKLKPLFAQAVPTLWQNYELHALHDKLTLITDGMRKETAPIQQIWKCFLERIQDPQVGLKLHMPDGAIHSLSSATELKRLEGKELCHAVRYLHPTDPDFAEMIDKIVAIEKDAFGRYGTFTAERLKEPNKYHFFIATSLAAPPSSVWLQMRESLKEESPAYYATTASFAHASDDLLGFAYLEEIAQPDGSKTLYFTGIARHPAAARLDIGRDLLESVFCYPGFQHRAFSLQVRESNIQARKLYERFGFIYGPREPNYYAEPTEDALNMFRKAPFPHPHVPNIEKIPFPTASLQLVEEGVNIVEETAV